MIYNIFEDEEDKEKSFDHLWLLNKAKKICVEQFQNRGNSVSYFSFTDGYIKMTEALLKINHQTSISATKAAKYILDIQKTKDKELCFNSYGLITNHSHILQTVKLWNNTNKELHSSHQQNAYLREKNGKPPRVNKPRYNTHIVLSIKEKPNKKRIEALVNAVKDVQLHYLTAFGFDSFFTIHQNTDHLHAHLLIQNFNPITGKRINFPKSLVWAMKQDFASSLRSNGLNYCATFKNIDSLETKNNPELKKKARKDHFTNQMIKTFGEDFRPFLKKVLIESRLDDPIKQEKAKLNLKYMRTLDEPNSRTSLLSNWNTYKKQLLKHTIKSNLIKKYPSINPDSIRSFVDVIHAKYNKALSRSTTKNPETLEELKKAEQSYLNLENVSEEALLKFSVTKQLQLKRSKKIESKMIYGTPGKEYFNLLLNDLKYLESQHRIYPHSKETLPKLKKLQNELQSLLNRKIHPDTLFKRLIDRNSKDHQQFFTKRFTALKLHISSSSSVSSDQVHLDNIIKYYLMIRGNNPKLGYIALKKLTNEYIRLLKSNNPTHIDKFQNHLKSKINPNPYNLKFSINKQFS